MDLLPIINHTSPGSLWNHTDEVELTAGTDKMMLLTRSDEKCLPRLQFDFSVIILKFALAGDDKNLVLPFVAVPVGADFTA